MEKRATKLAAMGAFVTAVVNAGCSGDFATCDVTKTCHQSDASAGGEASGIGGKYDGGTTSLGEASAGAGGAGGSVSAGGSAGSKYSGGTTSSGGASTSRDPDAGLGSPGEAPDAGADGGSVDDHCAACDAHAQCTPSNAATPCKCIQGYDGDGTQCTRNVCTPLAGQGPTCDANATCTPSNAATPCKCIQGYDGDGKHCTRNLCTPLAGQGPTCGINATCSNTPAPATCTCTTGFGNCDGAADTTKGCETNITNDRKNCGQCGLACAGNLTCTNGLCGQVVTKLGLGYDASLALMANGTVRGWGSNSFNLLDPGPASSPPPYPTPTVMSQLVQARDLFVAGAYGCILPYASDTVSCWGSNEFLGGAMDQVVPGVVEMAGTDESMCARTGSGQVWCWGSSAELGNPDNVNDSLKPVAVPSVSNARRLFAGLGAGYCAIRTNDIVVCWSGFNPFFNVTPTTLLYADGSPVNDAVDISIGANSYCVVRKNGTVACAGHNDYGQLGRGSAADTDTGVPLGNVPGLSDVVDVVAGDSHYCARTKTTGALYCWGRAEEGQLGLGPNAGVVPSTYAGHVISTPTQVPGLSGILEMAAGYEDTCVRLSTGQVQCFGNNQNYTLGDGTQVQRPSPTNVVGLP